MRRKNKFLLCLVLAVWASAGFLVPQARGEGGSDDVRLLVRDLCRQINSFQPGKFESESAKAVWEDTADYLYQNFGSGPQKNLTAPSSPEEKVSAWSTSILEGEHDRKIQATWDKEKGKLDLTVSGDASGTPLGKSQIPVEEYVQRLEVDVVQEKDDKGGSVFRTKVPAKKEVETFVEECDEKGFLTKPNQVDLNGIWLDNEDKQWLISHPPLKSGDPQAEITLVLTNRIGYKTEFKGAIRRWVIEAEHLIVDPQAIADLPAEIRQKLAADRKYPYNIKLNICPKDGALYLKGTWKGLNVTYDPDTFVIKKIFVGYEKPLSLTRGASEKEYRIVKIDVDISGWEGRQSNLKNKIRDAERDLEWHREEQAKAKAELTKAEQVFDENKAAIGKAAEAIGKLESRLKGEELPEKPSEDLKRRLETKASLEQQIARLDDEIIELGEKKPDGWPEMISRKDKIQQDYREQLERVKKLIEEEYTKTGFNPEERRKKVKDELAKVKDQYWDLRKKIALKEYDIESIAHRIGYHQEKINGLEEQLTDMRQELGGLEERNTPVVDKIIVSGSDGQEVARWEAWAPFEAIQRVDEEIKKLGKLLEEMKETKEEASARFVEAANDASRALDAVTEAIMDSAYLQAAVETGYYAYDVVGKGWRKGGPFGALTEALGKAAEAYVMGGIKFAEADSAAIEASMMEQYDLESGLFGDITMGDIKSTAAKRVLKDTIFRKGKEKVNQHIMARVQQYMMDHMTDNLIDSINTSLPIETLEKKAKKIVDYNTYLKNLKTAKPYQLRDFAKGFLKDMSKTVLKEWVKGIEEKVWTDYFEKDIWTRSCFAGSQKATAMYWDIYDQYMAWQYMKKELVRGYDPRSGFKEMFSNPLKEGESYIVALDLHHPEGRREDLFIGERQALLEGDPDGHRFSFKAENLTRTENKGILLKIHFLQ